MSKRKTREEFEDAVYEYIASGRDGSEEPSEALVEAASEIENFWNTEEGNAMSEEESDKVVKPWLDRAYENYIRECDSNTILTNMGLFSVDRSAMNEDEKKLVKKLATNDASLHLAIELGEEHDLYFNVDACDVILWENNPCRWYFVRIEDGAIVGFNEVEEKTE